MSHDAVTDIQNVYWTREVAELLGVKEGTIRKYARLLEDRGYNFHRNDHDQRGFFDKDVIILRKIQELRKSKSMTLEDAANAIISMNPNNNLAPITPPVTDENKHHITRYDNVMNALQTLTQENSELKQILGAISDEMIEQKKLLQEQSQKIEQLHTELKESKQALNTPQEKQGFFAKLFK
ncbi:MerR family transcriptional regulator [Bacillus cereus]|uniref:MerR family transcriptional regulator n=1 Tax=Bacillus cereus TaxID=1396 RepID=UPI0018F6DC37|nr:MerR family transcriptional regulator [Bacillus cereus]MBJ8055043.1 MerR family transcriptional regulator [Bacillus cereus]